MASCPKCGKHLKSKRRDGTRACPRCGPLPDMRGPPCRREGRTCWGIKWSLIYGQEEFVEMVAPTAPSYLKKIVAAGIIGKNGLS